MAKKYKELFITEVQAYCSSNKVLDFKEFDYNGTPSMKVTTLKGEILFIGVSLKRWKTFYCSCTNIKTTHHTVVANIFKTALQKSSVSFIEDENGDLDRPDL